MIEDHRTEGLLWATSNHSSDCKVLARPPPRLRSHLQTLMHCIYCKYLFAFLSHPLTNETLQAGGLILLGLVTALVHIVGAQLIFGERTYCFSPSCNGAQRQHCNDGALRKCYQGTPISVYHISHFTTTCSHLLSLQIPELGICKIYEKRTSKMARDISTLL